MATYVEFYKIAFENAQRQPTGRDVMTFFEKVEELGKKAVDKIERNVNGEIYRISSYLWPDTGKRYVVIPIGKVKHGAPYVVAEDGKSLKALDENVYDVNILVYDAEYKTMILTNHKSAPAYDEIEDYFNTYLLPNDPMRLRITPIEYDAGIEIVSHASRIRNVIFTLDLRAGFADMIKGHMDDASSMIGFFKGMMQSSREDINGNMMKIEISLGRSEKRATLDKNALLDLLTELNIDSRTIKEIEVRYYGGGSERIDKARLKESRMMLKYQFPLNGSRIGAEYLKYHQQEAYTDKYGKYSGIIRRYFSNEHLGECDNEYAFVEEWNESH